MEESRDGEISPMRPARSESGRVAKKPVRTMERTLRPLKEKSGSVAWIHSSWPGTPEVSWLLMPMTS